MYKGGYQIVDFKDEVLTSGSVTTITGVYSRIKNNNRKVFLLSGLTVRANANATATALNDEIVNVSEDAGVYSATLSNGGSLSITSADAVTYTIS